MQVKMQVVERRKRPAEGFLGLEQVAHIGASVVPAAMAVAFRVERAVVIGELGVLVAEHSPAGVHKAILGVLSAAVGEHRAVPAHELLHTAHLGHEFRARAQV